MLQLVAQLDVHAPIRLFEAADLGPEMGQAAPMRHVQNDVLDQREEARSGRIPGSVEGSTTAAHDLVVGQAQQGDQDLLLAVVVVVEARDRETRLGGDHSYGRTVVAVDHEHIERRVEHRRQPAIFGVASPVVGRRGFQSGTVNTLLGHRCLLIAWRNSILASTCIPRS